MPWAKFNPFKGRQWIPDKTQTVVGGETSYNFPEPFFNPNGYVLGALAKPRFFFLTIGGIFQF